MAQFIQKLQDFAFSSDIGDVVVGDIAAGAEARVRISSRTGAAAAWVLLYDEKLVPVDGMVSLRNLTGMAELITREERKASLVIVIDLGYQELLTSATVVRGRADVGTSAAEFAQSHFLTILTGTKMTAAGREERLTYYGGAEPDECKVQATLVVGGSAQTRTGRLSPMTSADQYHTYDVSPAVVADELGYEAEQLVAYTVRCGNRAQDFQMMSEETEPGMSLRFLNSFGCEEFIHFRGTVSRKAGFTRSQIRINGRLRNYDISEEQTHTAVTGWLSDDMVEWAAEVLRSYDVWWWQDGRALMRVVVTDSKLENTLDDDAWSTMEVTFKYEQREQNIVRLQDGRIFDSTFDTTFN